MNMKNISFFAGLFFILLATFTQGLLPGLQPESTQTKVTKVIRTDLGELKWTVGEATDYTDIQAKGRKVYIREGCSYCHSQYVRPVAGESRRWGPVSQAGEYAFDLPHLFSTRRIGPDLTRVGLKYSNGWHFAHFWDPRMLTPGSIMPNFSALFDGPVTAQIVTDSDGNVTLESDQRLDDFFNFESDKKLLITPNKDGLVFVSERGKKPIIHTPNDEFTGTEVKVISASEDLTALVAYLQKLGMNRGKWRDLFAPQRMAGSTGSMPRSDEWVEHGEYIYSKRCAGCHGIEGDGNGLAATFMKARPRNFNAGSFKFRMTPSGSMPTDGDLMRTISRGIRGTSMPPFHNMTEKDRMAVVLYIKYELSVDRSDPELGLYYYFIEEESEPPIYIGRAPDPSQDYIARGAEVWDSAKCWECHGNDGRGDGKKAIGLEDDEGFYIIPADLTTGLFKSGSGVSDIYRTITTGLNGTPMPSYGDSYSDDDRWALAYFVTTMSAYTDSLSGESLAYSEVDRKALNDPSLQADSTRKSYVLELPEDRSKEEKFAGGAWAFRRGMGQSERLKDDAENKDPSKNKDGAGK